MLEIKDLTKQYGKRTAVDRLSLSVEAGEIFGFVGPNGAGKTSTIRMIATLLQPTQGDIRVAGHSIRASPREVRRAIGYLPDFFGVYSDMTAWEYLDFFGACYHIPEANRRGLIDDLMELVDLIPRRADRVDRLSRGMQQRLGLARTLIHDPQLLVLDEPASGLDPRARVEIRELLVELARMGKTIFFSTHILADVAEICTRVGIIEAGQLVAVGTLEELQKNLVSGGSPHPLVGRGSPHLLVGRGSPHLLVGQRDLHVTVLDRAQEAQSLLASVPGVSAVDIRPDPNHAGHTRLEVRFMGDDAALSDVLAALVGGGIRVIHFSEDSRNLEEVFMRLTKGTLA